MRQVFKFDRLPETFFVNQLIPLPELPEELETKWRQLFPISDPKEDRKQSKLGVNGKEQIPDDISLIQEKIFQIEGNESSLTIPITEYNKIDETIKVLKKTYDFHNLSTHLLQLPELEKPQWDIFAYDSYDS
ncbi:177_t:CDS:2, partial [Gigaspora rosea]